MKRAAQNSLYVDEAINLKVPRRNFIEMQKSIFRIIVPMPGFPILKKNILRFFVIFIYIIMFTNTSFAQLTRLSLDLKNNFSFNFAQNGQGKLNYKTYEQYYLLGLSGYFFSEKFLEFSLQTSLSSFSSTNKANELSQKLKSNNFNFYNFSATILPRKSFPLTIYASRNRIDNINSSTHLLSNISRRYSIETEMSGLRWKINKNNFLPRMEITFEHRSNKSVANLAPVNQKSDAWSLRLSNSSLRGKTQYSFQYTGSHSNDKVLKLKQMHQQFQFYGSSKILNHTNIYTNAFYYIYKTMTIRNIEVGGSYRQKNGNYFRLRLLNSENRLTFPASGKSVINGINGNSYLLFSRFMQGNFGFNYMEMENAFENSKFLIDNGNLRGRLNYKHQFSFININTSLGTRLGFKSRQNDKRKFTQQTQFSFGGDSRIFRHFQINFYINSVFITNYYFGNILKNNFHLKVSSNVIPRSSASVEFSRSFNKYLNFKNISLMSGSSVRLNISTRILPTATVNIQHSQTWNYSWYLWKTYRTLISISEYGLIRNLTLQLRAERASNSITKITILKLEGTFRYRFYAFSFAGSFSLYSVAGFYTQGFKFEIRRPFNFSFR